MRISDRAESCSLAHLPPPIASSLATGRRFAPIARHRIGHTHRTERAIETAAAAQSVNDDARKQRKRKSDPSVAPVAPRLVGVAVTRGHGSTGAH